MQAFRTSNGIVRTLNLSVLMFFTVSFYAPSALAIKESAEELERQADIEASLPQNQSEVALYAYKLKQMKGHFAEAERLYVDKKGSVIGNVTDVVNAIENGGSLFKDDERWKIEMNTGMGLASEAQSMNNIIDQDFEAEAQWIKSKKLDPVILERLNESRGLYTQRVSEFEEKLQVLQKAEDEDEQISALKELNKYLSDQQFGRKHQEYDPENLGHSKPASAEGKPVLITKSDYFRNGIESNPQIQVAQAGGSFDFSQLPGADDPAFLAESDEVVISQMIRDQATDLENDPVKIYHWVRNNIETIPGWVRAYLRRTAR